MPRCCGPRHNLQCKMVEELNSKIIFFPCRDFTYQQSVFFSAAFACTDPTIASDSSVQTEDTSGTTFVPPQGLVMIEKSMLAYLNTEISNLKVH